jgi:predicted NAD/FAD-binding protein
MVYNEVTYPNLTRLFRDLAVETKPSCMSFSVQHVPSGLEYCGSSLNQLFSQRRNICNGRFIRMLLQISRFNRDAVEALQHSEVDGQTLGEYASARGYGQDFLDCYLLPMSSAIWSTPAAGMLEFPASTLLRFFHNHGFLGMYTQHPWRTVSGGSHSYVAKLVAPFRQKIRLKQRVARVIRGSAGVKVVTESRESENYDGVILACHADQALELLDNPTPRERRLLGKFRYQPNRATLHTDAAVMPRTQRAWASWNYRMDASGPGSADEAGAMRASTIYWMNRLQGVSESENYFVSINDPGLVDPQKILNIIDYEHPIFTLDAIQAQNDLPKLNRVEPDNGVFFCGSYFKYGFHEDALNSALGLCALLLQEPLWKAA